VEVNPLNTYEVLVIFKPILDVENVDNTINHFQKNIVEANGGEVAEMDRIGRKRLAYEIKKFKDGFLTLFLLKFPPDKVVDFRRACQINDDILRVTLVSQDHLPERLMLKEETPMGGRPDGGRFRDRDDRRGPGGGGFRGGPPPRRDFNNQGGQHQQHQQHQAPQQQPVPQQPAEA
jgi:small subunit ribosomal protein S6